MRAPWDPAMGSSRWGRGLALDLGEAAAVALYLWGARRGRRRWPAPRTLSFLAGVGCVLVALQSGIGRFDDALLSVHMVQHMLLLLVAPLLLLGGKPTLLALRALPAAGRRRLAMLLERLRPLTAPWCCLTAFSIVVLGTHLPWFYDATLREPILHDGEHLAYLLAGLLLWWPILDGDPAVTRRIGGLARLG